MAGKSPQFYNYPQSEALSILLPILHPHLPHSNPLYNRIQAPHNIPFRHCLFAATFPPSTPTPENYTILFADRSRHSESQIWLFNPLITRPSNPGLSNPEKESLASHLHALILYLKNIQIPEAPGWPFSPILRFAILHEYLTSALVALAKERDALARISNWNLWLISTTALASRVRERRPLANGYSVGRVPEDQLDIVLTTSTIPRQASTMLMLPNVGLLNQEGILVAWGYIGIDGSFATLYVVPEERGKGLAGFVAVELLGRLSRGEFKDLEFYGRSGWAHSDVHEGNRESEGVMRSLGGSVGWISSYVWVDSGKFEG